MERSDDESSSPVTENKESLPFHHSDSSADDITKRVTCSGEGEEVASSTFTTSSGVSSCHGPEGDGHHLDEATCQVDLNPVTLASDSDTQVRGWPSDPRGANSDDDVFMTQLTLPGVAAVSRNTFECSRRSSAPGQLVQDDQGSESELQSRRPGIVEYFSR